MRAKRPVAVAPWWKWINKVVGLIVISKVSCGELRPLGRLTHKTPYKRWPRCAPPTARHTRENDKRRGARGCPSLDPPVARALSLGSRMCAPRESRVERRGRGEVHHYPLGRWSTDPVPRDLHTGVRGGGASDTFPAPAATRIDDPKCVTPISFVESQPRKQQRACTVQRPACSLALRVTGAPRNH